jgi:UPF0271 protein
MNFDINCDFGEGYGRYELGDMEILDYVSSVNIACGYHAGDPVKINSVIKKAVEKNINIGAHPSYPDLLGFGRRSMDISTEELYSYTLYQISSLYGMSKANGGKLSHVKAHGALYHDLEKKDSYAECFVKAVKDLDPEIRIVGMANGKLEKEVEKLGMKYVREGFSDRAYSNDLSLVSRSLPGAVLHNIEDIVVQVKNIINGKVRCIDGDIKKIDVDTICIHGDGINSLEIAIALKKMMKENNIQMKGLEE